VLRKGSRGDGSRICGASDARLVSLHSRGVCPNHLCVCCVVRGGEAPSRKKIPERAGSVMKAAVLHNRAQSGSVIRAKKTSGKTACGKDVLMVGVWVGARYLLLKYYAGGTLHIRAARTPTQYY